MTQAFSAAAQGADTLGPAPEQAKPVASCICLSVLLSLTFVSLPVKPQSEQCILLWLLSLLQFAEPRIGCFHLHAFT